MPWSDFLWKLQILQRFCKFCNRYLVPVARDNNGNVCVIFFRHNDDVFV